ncbi:G2/M phase-specific E3 ubiquitin-protein ligase-like [Erpetoichthys calabaricus]|uniref:G2/M phase-specific E3 ubiquitin-protein ligase-like n=1 Tax=Erpetoichthys calabaricus TaxID=27687 RepID=UPI002233F81D|nr:G2/M phase-specific E3 ubiquitin-protein ligase-like [Erpetoichthys calabaricus]
MSSVRKPRARSPALCWAGSGSSAGHETVSDTPLIRAASVRFLEEHAILSDSDFECPAPQRRRVSQRQRERGRRPNKENQEGHQDAKSSGWLHLEKGRVDDRHEGAENSSPVSDLTPTGLEEDENVEEANGESLLQDSVNPSQDLRSSKVVNKEEITEVLQAHSKKVITPSYRRIFISRLDVWTTAFRYFHQDRFARHHGLLVVSFACDLHTFKMEPPDCGGPRREFFRRLIKAIFEDSGAFEESPNGFIPKLNTSHLENGVYRTIGKMMSTIIIQGGEPPARLAPCVVDYILAGDVLQVNATPDDVSASELREMLKKVETLSTERELEDTVKQCDSWRFEVEGLPNPVNMNTKDTFVKKAALFHVILKRQACLDQLIDGLSYYEVLPLFRENPSMRIFLDMPKIKKEFTADDIAGMFMPRYSKFRSRVEEETMVLKFREFLEYIQGKELKEKLYFRILTKAEKTFLKTLRPVDILQFATGSSTIPTLGFNPRPHIVILYGDQTGLPKANTSRNELQICFNLSNMSISDEFNYSFIQALMNSPVCR